MNNKTLQTVANNYNKKVIFPIKTINLNKEINVPMIHSNEREPLSRQITKNIHFPATTNE